MKPPRGAEHMRPQWVKNGPDGPETALPVCPETTDII